MPQRKPRVLVVDDDPEIREVLKRALEGNYSLELAERANEAWELLFFFGDSFDLIMLDIVMPKCNGLELLKKIRDVNPYLPVLILTGQSTKESAEEACNLGVSGYITKPFDIRKMREKIREIIGGNKNIFPNLAQPGFLLKNKNFHFFHAATVRCLREIHKKFHTTFDIKSLASICGVSEYHLCKLFKKDCGLTIREYATRLRMAAAKRLLKGSSYKISDIQEMLGYKSRTHFFSTFRTVVGMSPLIFRSIRNNHKEKPLKNFLS